MTHPAERPLKIGLLGSDPRIAAVADAARQRGDAIVIACLSPEHEPIGIDGVPRSSAWEPLLDEQTCDAILVGSDAWSDVRAEAVRGLVQAGRTLLLSHPLSLSMLWAYELDMIRGDSGSRLIPWLPDRLHPFMARLKAQIESAVADAHPWGPLETVTMERRMPDRSRDAVLRQLARDADLVRVLAGDPQRLGTLGGTVDTAWPTLSVGFTGSGQIPVRWGVARGESSLLSIALTHARGSTTVTVPDDATVWTWVDEPGGSPTVSASFDRAAVLVDQLHLAVLGGPRPTALSAVPVAGWPDAARAIELAETVPRSLAKGRAIDLHQEEFSEIGTFKGTMASLGCGIVLAALGILVLASLVGGIAREAGWGAGERIAAAWPVVVLFALAAFLLLQVLPWLVGGNADDAGRTGSEASPGRDPSMRP